MGANEDLARWAAAKHAVHLASAALGASSRSKADDDDGDDDGNDDDQDDDLDLQKHPHGAKMRGASEAAAAAVVAAENGVFEGNCHCNKRALKRLAELCGRSASLRFDAFTPFPPGTSQGGPGPRELPRDRVKV